MDTTLTPEHSSWRAMRRRCYDPKNASFNHYGGKGVKVFARWLGKDGFKKFLRDMGPRPKGTSLDRYPNRNGDYEPGNCRWATVAQQQANRDIQFDDLTGQRFGKLIAQWPVGRSDTRSLIWLCLCDCGSLILQGIIWLKRSKRSCGCDRTGPRFKNMILKGEQT